MADAVDDFLSGYDPGVTKTARATRKLVRRLVPDAEEKLHRGWKVIAYGRKGKFCAIAPHSTRVNLQFHAGASLEDPSGLLEGTGKSMRHVKLSSPADVERNAVARLIESAAERAG